jgi:hypothetical protein
MIGSLKGRLLAVEPPMILLDVHGVGFELQLPLSDLSELPAVGGELKVSTQLVQREDELSLYGFRKTADRAWFRELIRVPGIGPKLALNIVSQSGVAEFAEQMAQVPPMVIKGGAAGAAFLMSLLFPIVLSAITYVIFVFIRGDEARIKQHICVVAHAGVISALGAILNAIVNMRGGALQETLSVGTFFPFLPDGYFTELLLALDLFQLWGAAVAGIGLAAIDPRRSAGSTAAILIALVVVIGLIRAAF